MTVQVENDGAHRAKAVSAQARVIAILALLCVVCAGATDSSLTNLLAQYKTQPGNARLCQQIGLAYAQSGDFTQAIVFLRKVVRLDPERAPARNNLATVLWFAGQKPESVELFRQLENSNPDNPVPQLYLGLSAYEHKDFEQAARHLERAGALAAENPEVRPVLIETYLSTGRVERARQAIQIELNENPKSAKLLLELGLSYGLQGDFQRGREALLQATAVDPHWSLPLIALGITDLQTGSAASAAEYFRRAKLIAPDDYRCYYLRALALRHSDMGSDPKTVAEEVRDLQRATALESGQPASWVALGEAEMSLRRDAEAEAAFRKALHLQPDQPAALYKLAALCRREGKMQQSAALLSTLRDSKRKTQTDEAELMSLLRTVNSKQ